MAEQPTSVSDLLRLAFEAYRDEYRELSDNWRNLDTKAQGLGAIAGIFLAAVFTWSRALPATYNWVQGLLLAGSIVLLVATVVAAVLALQVRTVSLPPLGEETAEMISDMVRGHRAEELPQLVANFYHDQMRVWKDTNEEMGDHCASKASRVRYG